MKIEIQYKGNDIDHPGQKKRFFYAHLKSLVPSSLSSSSPPPPLPLSSQAPLDINGPASYKSQLSIASSHLSTDAVLVHSEQDQALKLGHLSKSAENLAVAQQQQQQNQQQKLLNNKNSGSKKSISSSTSNNSIYRKDLLSGYRVFNNLVGLRNNNSGSTRSSSKASSIAPKILKSKAAQHHSNYHHQSVSLSGGTTIANMQIAGGTAPANNPALTNFKKKSDGDIYAYDYVSMSLIKNDNNNNNSSSNAHNSLSTSSSHLKSADTLNQDMSSETNHEIIKNPVCSQRAKSGEKRRRTYTNDNITTNGTSLDQQVETSNDGMLDIVNSEQHCIYEDIGLSNSSAGGLELGRRQKMAKKQSYVYSDDDLDDEFDIFIDYDEDDDELTGAFADEDSVVGRGGGGISDNNDEDDGSCDDGCLLHDNFEKKKPPKSTRHQRRQNQQQQHQQRIFRLKQRAKESQIISSESKLFESLNTENSLSSNVLNTNIHGGSRHDLSSNTLSLDSGLSVPTTTKTTTTTTTASVITTAHGPSSTASSQHTSSDQEMSEKSLNIANTHDRKDDECDNAKLQSISTFMSNNYLKRQKRMLALNTNTSRHTKNVVDADEQSDQQANYDTRQQAALNRVQIPPETTTNEHNTKQITGLNINNLNLSSSSSSNGPSSTGKRRAPLLGCLIVKQQLLTNSNHLSSKAYDANPTTKKSINNVDDNKQISNNLAPSKDTSLNCATTANSDTVCDRRMSGHSNESEESVLSTTAVHVPKKRNSLKPMAPLAPCALLSSTAASNHSNTLDQSNTSSTTKQSVSSLTTHNASSASSTTSTGTKHMRKNSSSSHKRMAPTVADLIRQQNSILIQQQLNNESEPASLFSNNTSMNSPIVSKLDEISANLLISRHDDEKKPTAVDTSVTSSSRIDDQDEDLISIGSSVLLNSNTSATSTSNNNNNNNNNKDVKNSFSHLVVSPLDVEATGQMSELQKPPISRNNHHYENSKVPVVSVNHKASFQSTSTLTNSSKTLNEDYNKDRKLVYTAADSSNNNNNNNNSTALLNITSHHVSTNNNSASTSTATAATTTMSTGTSTSTNSTTTTANAAAVGRRKSRSGSNNGKSIVRINFDKTLTLLVNSSSLVTNGSISNREKINDHQHYQQLIDYNTLGYATIQCIQNDLGTADANMVVPTNDLLSTPYNYSPPSTTISSSKTNSIEDLTTATTTTTSSKLTRSSSSQQKSINSNEMQNMNPISLRKSSTVYVSSSRVQNNLEAELNLDGKKTTLSPSSTSSSSVSSPRPDEICQFVPSLINQPINQRQQQSPNNQISSSSSSSSSSTSPMSTSSVSNSSSNSSSASSSNSSRQQRRIVNVKRSLSLKTDVSSSSLLRPISSSQQHIISNRQNATPIVNINSRKEQEYASVAYQKQQQQAQTLSQTSQQIGNRFISKVYHHQSTMLNNNNNENSPLKNINSTELDVLPTKPRVLSMADGSVFSQPTGRIANAAALTPTQQQQHRPSIIEPNTLLRRTATEKNNTNQLVSSSSSSVMNVTHHRVSIDANLIALFSNSNTTNHSLSHNYNSASNRHIGILNQKPTTTSNHTLSSSSASTQNSSSSSSNNNINNNSNSLRSASAKNLDLDLPEVTWSVPHIRRQFEQYQQNTSGIVGSTNNSSSLAYAAGVTGITASTASLFDSRHRTSLAQAGATLSAAIRPSHAQSSSSSSSSSSQVAVTSAYMSNSNALTTTTTTSIDNHHQPTINNGGSSECSSSSRTSSLSSSSYRVFSDANGNPTTSI